MKTSGLGLKAKIQYSTWDNSNWHCYYHGLSGDELKNQIISIFYKPTGDERSWQFVEISSSYKLYQEQGLRDWIVKTYNANIEDVEELIGYIKQFFDDACEEFGRKSIVKESVNA